VHEDSDHTVVSALFPIARTRECYHVLWWANWSYEQL